jgi:hypothetical protein
MLVRAAGLLTVALTTKALRWGWLYDYFSFYLKKLSRYLEAVCFSNGDV